jgi:hypothetical protein
MTDNDLLETMIRDIAALRNVADQFQCQKLQERYWYAEAIRDPEMIASCFADDGQYGKACGMEEIRSICRHNMAHMDMVIENYHIVPIAPDIEVKGDTARGDVRGLAFITVRKVDGSQKVVGLGIGYRNEYVRTKDGWKFSSMYGIHSGPDDFHDTTWIFETDLAAPLNDYLEGSA